MKERSNLPRSACSLKYEHSEDELQFLRVRRISKNLHVIRLHDFVITSKFTDKENLKMSFAAF